jgi:Prophage minor tail protein Z (GPZ)
MPKAGISLTFDFEAYLEVIRTMRPPQLDRPAALALVDTAKAANARAARAIAVHTGLKAADVRPRLFYDRVNIGDYETFVRSSRKVFPLIAFKAVQTGVGVRASKPWGKTQVFRSAFIANAGGSPRVFRRVGKSRLPIKQMWGPSIHSTFKQPDVVHLVKATIRERLPVLLARRIKAEFRRARK